MIDPVHEKFVKELTPYLSKYWEGMMANIGPADKNAKSTLDKELLTVYTTLFGVSLDKYRERRGGRNEKN